MNDSATSRHNAAAWADSDEPTLRFERRLRHPVEKVWRAVTEAPELSAWFPFEVSYTSLVPGARITFSEQGFTDHGEILEVDPPRLFAFTWGEERFRIELTPDGDTTALTFLHTFGDRYGAASFATGWDTCLDALTLSLDGRVPTPGDMSAPHERYVELLGLDHPQVERTADGWKVRAERQLVRPEAAARAAIDRFGDWGGDSVHVEFTEGTGHGTRIVVTETGHRDGDLDAARDRWHDRLARLGAALASGPASDTH
jgi:uncharacterized protein YndB with AHSA1/START domain